MRWGIAVLLLCVPRVSAAGTVPGYLEMIPLEGETSDDVIDVNPDAVPDLLGIGLGGATSNETSYDVDDLPTSDVVFGGDALSVPIELVDSMTIDPGRGIVHVTTPTAGDEWLASAFGDIVPWIAHGPGPDLDSGPIRAATEGTVAGRLGGQFGGPIVKQRLWIWGGVVASGAGFDVDRQVVRPSDEKLLDDRHIGTYARSLFAIGKLDAAPRDGAKLGVELIAVPTDATGVNPYGWVDQQRTEMHTLTTATLLHGSIEHAGATFSAAVGLYHERDHGGSLGGARDDVPRVDQFDDLETLARLGGESQGVIDGCAGGACGMVGYATGGPGPLTDQIAQRASARLVASDSIGAHQLALTLDGDLTQLANTHHLSGGYWMFGTLTTRNLSPTRMVERSRGGSIDLADTWKPVRDLQILAHLGYQAQRLDGDAISVGAWTPDVAVTYDPSHQQRAQLYVAWYRRMERIPLDLVDRNLTPWRYQDDGTIYEPTTTPIDPSLAPQVAETFGAGARRACDGDFVLGAHVLVSHLVHVVEDAGGEITNPPDARRLHTAISLTAERPFAGGFALFASYTYAHTTGTYPGLLDESTGQVDPNILEVFDQPSGNEQGPLPQDRRHSLVLDAAWAPSRGFHAGLRLRARSGMPIDLRASGALVPEPFLLLPRGSGGRTPWITDLDTRIGYTRHHFTIDLDILHVTNTQDVVRVDDVYGYASAPIVGGTPADLTASGIKRYPSFGLPLERVAPLAFRVAARYEF